MDLTSSPWRPFETYADCERCLNGCADVEDEDRRSNFRCCLNYSKSKWQRPGFHLRRWFGGPNISDGHKPTESDVKDAWARLELNPSETFESNEDGCPGSWYRTRFYFSLSHYLRTESEGGAFSPNLLLDRCDDYLIIEAVQRFEKYRTAWSRWRDQAVADHNRMK